MSLENSSDFLLNLSVGDVNEKDKYSYRFKSFRLDAAERRLLSDGVSVPLMPKVFDVLALLVERHGHLVEKSELLNTVWADTFVEETNITRIIYELRKVLGEDKNGNKFIETVAKKGYRFVAEVEKIYETPAAGSTNGKPESLNFAGNPTASGELQFPVFKDDENTALPAARPKQKARIVLFAVGFLSAVFLILFLSFSFQSGNPGKTKSIAILPVNPVNAANRDDIYEIGIAESLITRLGAMKGLIVRPLGATRQYANINQDPIAAGRELKVDYVLASNYQIADGKIRITAQLFNVSSGQAEETYKSEKEAGNFFALQDAIAGEIGNLLLNRFALTPNTATAKRGTTNEEAYRLYLQGKNLTMRRNQAEAKKAVEYLEQAIRLDPNFALAYAQMAHAYRKSNLGGESESEKVREFINKALELDPHLAEAYVARAENYLLEEWNFAAVEKDLAKAIELEPNNDAAHWLNALLLAYRGRFDEALTEIETAQAIDPGAVMYMYHRGRILYYARRYDEAIEQYKRAIDLDERFIQPHGWMLRAYEMKGDHARAYEFFIEREKRGGRMDVERLETYQKAYEAAGWTGVRQKSLEFSVNESFFDNARLSAMQGEKDAAFEYLNKAVEKGSWLMITVNVEPAFDSLHDDPRFDELLRRVGMK